MNSPWIYVVFAFAFGGYALVAWIAVSVFRQSVALNRSHDETQAKGVALVMQTAAAVSERVEARVKDRVGHINTFVRGGSDAQVGGSMPVGEMPPPPIRQSGTITEEHEVLRELNRLQREGADPVRDPGIGQEDGMPPMPAPPGPEML